MDYSWIKDEAKKVEERVIGHRRYLHENAEAGFDLKKSYTYVFRELERLGLEPQKCGKCGIVCLINGEKEVEDGEKKCVLLRADMDALPISEQTSLPFACKTGNMHACGHDMHTASLLGCAEILSKNKEKLCGIVKLIFQPAEEELEGAKNMIENGALESPRIDFGAMLHTINYPNLPTGMAIIHKNETIAPSCDIFEVTVEGEGGHGAMPHLSKSPILPLCSIALELSALPEIAPRNSGTILTIGEIHSGKAPNIIPERAILRGTLRTLSPSYREEAKKLVFERTVSLASIQNCQGSVAFLSGAPAFKNDTALAKIAEEALKQALGKDMVKNSEELSSQSSNGSEPTEEKSTTLFLDTSKVLSADAHPSSHDRTLTPLASTPTISTTCTTTTPDVASPQAITPSTTTPDVASSQASTSPITTPDIVNLQATTSPTTTPDIATTHPLTQSTSPSHSSPSATQSISSTLAPTLQRASRGQAGSEDFAYFAEKIPAIMVNVASGKGKGPLHSPRAEFDESALVNMTATYTALAISFLEAKN